MTTKTTTPAIDPATGDEIISVREFAVREGYKPNYGHELAKAGRLVMAADGKNCLARASHERFNASKDPSKQGVAERHAAAREAAAAADVPRVPAEAGQDKPGDVALYDFQNAKAKREHWAAEREHAAYRKEAGELMERGDVVAAFADAGATVRSKLEAWSATLPPQLAGRDEAAIRAVLADQVEQVLRELADKFGRMAGDAVHA